MDLFEKVDLFEKAATDLADDSSVPEASKPNELTKEFASTAQTRRASVEIRTGILKSLVG